MPIQSAQYLLVIGQYRSTFDRDSGSFQRNLAFAEAGELAPNTVAIGEEWALVLKMLLGHRA
jgi:hypothetical protein